jgi:hypothetical protein
MSSLKLIGPTQYKRLLAALEYYERAGYKYVDVPWAVSRDAILLTRPSHITCEPVNYEAGGKAVYPVASAEQSFIQMKMDDPNFSGKLVTLTPCFRNEPVIDELHQPYFMKVELINWLNSALEKNAPEVLNKMIADARLLLEGELFVDVVHNTDPDPLGVAAYDIVTAKTGIELGSYGIRRHPKVGAWLYGTGLAEPRYSLALDKEPQIEAFF